MAVGRDRAELVRAPHRSTVAATACGLGLGDVLERSGKLRAFGGPGVASAGLSLMGVMAHHVTALGACALVRPQKPGQGTS